ncbi:MAG: hypothetical protein KBD78_17045 [Oligoflexales bacterium]|nr:hypothetical protein [Oligoflexales bacterium]
MEKLKRILYYVFSTEFLLKALIVFSIITLARGEFVIKHTGYIDVSSSYGGFDLNIKSNNQN